MTYEERVKELEQQGYKEHHTSWCRGYVSRKDGYYHDYRYKGRFGEGWAIETPSWDSSHYHYITYFTK